MKKFCFLFLCLCLSSCVFAQEVNYDSDQTNPQVREYESDTTDAYFDNNVVEQYGSEQSPAFLNRENINPNEDSYDYGSTDGMNYDSYNDASYQYE